MAKRPLCPDITHSLGVFDARIMPLLSLSSQGSGSAPPDGRRQRHLKLSFVSTLKDVISLNFPRDHSLQRTGVVQIKQSGADMVSVGLAGYAARGALGTDPGDSGGPG